MSNPSAALDLFSYSALIAAAYSGVKAFSEVAAASEPRPAVSFFVVLFLLVPALLIFLKFII